jgi:hypothetical protein
MSLDKCEGKSDENTVIRVTSLTNIPITLNVPCVKQQMNYVEVSDPLL